MNLAPVRHRWPVVSFGNAPARPEPTPAAVEEIGLGDVFDLDRGLAAVKPRAAVVDFGRGTGREATGDTPAGPPEGTILDLDPRPEVVHPTWPSVVIKPDPNQPKSTRRQRRWKAEPDTFDPVTAHDEAVMVDIERAIADAVGAGVLRSPRPRADTPEI